MTENRTKSKKGKGLVVAIDGPSAAGKSTLAKLVAKELDYLHLDTGAMYRAVGWKADRLQIPLHEGDKLAALARDLKIRFKCDADGRTRVIADGEDVTGKIRSRHAGELASRVSAVPGVRRAMVTLQRQMGACGGVVAEGRDMQTVVFPGADVKIFLTASVAERSRRRQLELQQKGIEVGLAEIESEIEKRDRRDSTRADSPLRAAPDAHIVDTDKKTTEKVLDETLKIVARRLKETREP